MVTWWVWVFVWAALVAAAAWTMYLLGRSLWRKAMALLRELSLASERLTVLSEELGALATPPPGSPDLAVFDSPARLRRERAGGGGYRARHRAGATARR